MANGLRKTYAYTCRVCSKPGKSYNPKAQAHNYCQKITTVIKDRKLSSCTDLVRLPKPPKEKKTNKPYGRYLWISGYCSVCTKAFTFHGSHRTCSLSCTKQHKEIKALDKARRRRARKKGLLHEPIVSLKVYERDNWICGICKQRVNPEAKNLMDRPSLDHVIALANNGTHTYGNVQLAHRICNSIKRDT
jgi:hypothetical protein